MERAYLGATEIRVSRIILGCGNFGGVGSAPAFFGKGETRDESFAIMDAAWEAGITTFDTADAYGGWLTGKYRRGEPPPPGSRMAQRPEPYEHLRRDRVYDALERLDRLAAERGSSSAALAIAWLLAEPRVTAVVVGPRRPGHLEPALAALRLASVDRDGLADLVAS